MNKKKRKKEKRKAVITGLPIWMYHKCSSFVSRNLAKWPRGMPWDKNVLLYEGKSEESPLNVANWGWGEGGGGGGGGGGD